MKGQIKVLLILVVLLCHVESYSQAGKNSVFLTGGTVLKYSSLSLSYERLITYKKESLIRQLCLTTGVGVNARTNPDLNGTNEFPENGFVFSLGIKGLSGIRKGHMELGFGIGYFMDYIPSDDFIEGVDYVDDSKFFPSLSIGFRRQITNGLVFRSGLGLVEWVYLGVGLRF